MGRFVLLLLLSPTLLAGCTEPEPTGPLDVQAEAPSVWSVALRNEGDVRMTFEVAMDGERYEGGLEPGASWQRLQYLTPARDHTVEVAVAHGDALALATGDTEVDFSVTFRPEECRGSPAYHDFAGRPGREPLSTENGLSFDSNCV